MIFHPLLAPLNDSYTCRQPFFYNFAKPRSGRLVQIARSGRAVHKHLRHGIMASWRVMFPKVSKGKRPKTAGPFEKTGVLTVLSADAKWNGYDIWMIYIYMMKNNRFFISFVGPSIALKVSTKVLALPPKESLSNCLKWLGDLGDGSGFATWKWNNMENHLRPPGKMHVGDGAWLEWLSGFGVGTHFSQRHKGEFDWSCTMFYCNFTILYHNVSCTWVLPFQMFLKNLT